MYDGVFNLPLEHSGYSPSCKNLVLNELSYKTEGSILEGNYYTTMRIYAGLVAATKTAVISGV